jgi:hypothetical protein
MERTTKGIDFAVSQDVVVLDVEGFDSSSRSEDTGSIANAEGKLALFVLLATDVIIINVMVQDINCYVASGMKLLETIIKTTQNLQNQRATKRKIVFFIRDFDADSHSFEVITANILSNVERVFESINIPQSEVQSSIDLLFYAFPHFKYCLKDFIAKVEEIKPLFTKQGLFSDQLGVSTLVLSQTFKTIWEAVLSNEELNLPDARSLINLHKLTEVKDQIVQEMLGEVEAVKLRTRDMTSLNDSLESLVLQFMDKYATSSKELQPDAKISASLTRDLEIICKQAVEWKEAILTANSLKSNEIKNRLVLELRSKVKDLKTKNLNLADFRQKLAKKNLHIEERFRTETAELWPDIRLEEEFCNDINTLDRETMRWKKATLLANSLKCRQIKNQAVEKMKTKVQFLMTKLLELGEFKQELSQVLSHLKEQFHLETSELNPYSNLIQALNYEFKLAERFANKWKDLQISNSKQCQSIRDELVADMRSQVEGMRPETLSAADFDGKLAELVRGLQLRYDSSKTYTSPDCYVRSLLDSDLKLIHQEAMEWKETQVKLQAEKKNSRFWKIALGTVGGALIGSVGVVLFAPAAIAAGTLLAGEAIFIGVGATAATGTAAGVATALTAKED